MFNFLQAVDEVQAIYNEAYEDYIRDAEKGNKTLIQFHDAVSNVCEHSLLLFNASFKRFQKEDGPLALLLCF